MSDCLREADTIARMGGDEFTVILDNIETVEAAVEAAQRMLEALSQPMDLGGQECLISSSIGISIYPDNGLDAETLVKNADTAMYKAKENGRNGYFLYTEDLNAAALEKQTLENNLSKALERGELELYYQPQVAIRTGFPVGVEALARWHSQELGDISPNVFIPLAEETGLIIPIGEWVLRSACIQSKAWEDAGYAPRMVGVNISSRQFQQSDLVTSVSNILKETGLDPRRLNLEITESVLMQDPNHATQILHQLRKLGVLISLDDFGTGYSSLSYLKRFPIDVVKIDQSFVHDITHSAGDAAIACAVISLAHTLNLKVIAEGVETLEQLDFLRSLGCDEVQGYFVSPPIPPSEMDASMHSYQLERSEIGPLAA
jgi:predicted signal transduction protein with EAL and GGDEF domain